MSNTRYQPAPTRDSFDEQQAPSYTREPPSYQATSGGGGGNLIDDDEDILGSGRPREEDDNVPDDFKFGGSVAEAALPIRMQFVRKVYAILTVQLLLTVAMSSVSYFSPNYKLWIQTNTWMLWTSIIGSFAFLLLTFWKRKSYPANLLFLTGFTALEAYTISVVVSQFESGLVLRAVILTAGLFVGLTLFACQTKYDFTSWMPYLLGGLWFLILFGFMYAFFPASKTTELVYGGLAALIFSGYVLVDTQLIMRHHHVEEEIAAAISLYLDIINLFLAILRILNSQSNN